MPNFKCTLFTNGGGSGASHSFYRQAAQHTDLDQPCQDLARVLQKFCANGFAYVGYRISDDAIPGDGLLRFAPSVPPKGTGAEFDVDVPQAALYCRIMAGAIYRRPLHITQIPDVWVTYSAAVPNNPPAIAGNFVSELSRTLRTGWQIKAISKELDNQPKAITAIDPAALPPPQIGYTITIPAHGLTSPKQATISGCKEIDSLNGQRVLRPFSIGGITSADQLIVETPSFTTPVPYFRKGLAHLHVPYYAPITALEFVRFSVKRLAGAFFVRRGRHRRAVTRP